MVLNLDKSELLGLKTNYSSTFEKENRYASTVGSVHKMAEEQVYKYAALENETQQQEKNPKKVCAFAVTFVVNRPHVTEVNVED